jgi:cobalt transporter subunit CbtB
MDSSTISESGPLTARPVTGLTATRVGACAFAFLLGLGIVLTTGFSHLEAVHNAAHDTRHSLGFPCH